MTTFFSLLATGISCVFYGIVTAAVVMSVLYFILKSFSKGIVRSIPFYIIGVVLAFLLICNFSVIIGAFKVKGATDAMEMTLYQLSEQVSGVVNASESQQVFDYLVDQYPLLGNYLQVANFSGNDMEELVYSMPEEVRKEMNGVIWSKLLWALGYIVVACILAMIFDKGQGRKAIMDYDDIPASGGHSDDF